TFSSAEICDFATDESAVTVSKLNKLWNRTQDEDDEYYGYKLEVAAVGETEGYTLTALYISGFEEYEKSDEKGISITDSHDADIKLNGDTIEISGTDKYEVKSTDITVTLVDSNAEYDWDVNSTYLDDGETVTVTAEDGSEKEYTVEILLSGEAEITNITATNAEFVITTNNDGSGTISITETDASSLTYTDLTITHSDYATISCTDTTNTLTASDTITVTSEDGKTSVEYTISVTDANAGLNSINELDANSPAVVDISGDTSGDNSTGTPPANQSPAQQPVIQDDTDDDNDDNDDSSDDDSASDTTTTPPATQPPVQQPVIQDDTEGDDNDTVMEIPSWDQTGGDDVDTENLSSETDGIKLTFTASGFNGTTTATATTGGSSTLAFTSATAGSQLTVSSDNAYNTAFSWSVNGSSTMSYTLPAAGTTVTITVTITAEDGTKQSYTYTLTTTASTSNLDSSAPVMQRPTQGS
ncbi:MAG: hypothetical protein R3Y62_03140, partial [Eubacteriales bacterium]